MSLSTNHSSPRTHRSGHRRALILFLLLATALGSTATLADPADFQAMPGLWKIIVRLVSHGQPGAPTERWHCVDEGADPWMEFASEKIPGQTQCKRSDQHRSSSNLTWNLSCPGNPSASGKGHVDFDSPEHYTASVAINGQGDVLQVEGKRYAACTSPSD
jgi:hypothetical protein